MVDTLTVVVGQDRSDEFLYQSALDQSSDQIIITDADGNITFINEAAVRSLGFPREELIGGPVRRHGDPQIAQRHEEIVKRTMAEGSWRGEAAYIADDEREVVTETRTHLITGDAGEPVGIIGISTDITERVLAERDLRASEARFRALFEYSLTGTLFINPNGTVLEVNSRLLEILGSPSVEASKTINVLTTPQLVDSGFADGFRRCLETGEAVFGESYYTSVWGKSAYVRYSFNPVKDNDTIIGALASVDDITPLHDATEELKSRNREIETMLHEKEALLRELYHRTKNNMQVVASLIALRRSGAHEGVIAGLLAEIESKIHGIALVHEKLYHSRDLSQLDLGDYITDLVSLIGGSFQTDNGSVRTEVAAAPVPVLLDLAVPIGLVVNELVTNAAKHAFPNGRAGTIHVRLFDIDEDQFELQVTDDGVGLPDGLDPTTTDSVGLQTVMTIVTTQLHGSISVSSAASAGTLGTAWRIQISRAGHTTRV